ncbi:Uu.00g049620.m01.CDS01 [Anthostomella pinea]|uniref:Uu.00g049620.m01.CDS01 n=1 Tax=Anthostomella pinea TaxID=933095 RepID=A0AAI8YCE5_9PEZI|nr:Uu.00g049620.m01.CDS01 [Anthostomella pinea]
MAEQSIEAQMSALVLKADPVASDDGDENKHRIPDDAVFRVTTFGKIIGHSDVSILNRSPYWHLPNWASHLPTDGDHPVVDLLGGSKWGLRATPLTEALLRIAQEACQCESIIMFRVDRIGGGEAATYGSTSEMLDYLLVQVHPNAVD